MFKINGYFIVISVLVVLASSETIDNRTTPHNDRFPTSQRNPLPQEGTTTTIRFINRATPGAPATTTQIVPNGVTPPRSTQVSPARQDQTPSKATTTTSRPPTPSRSPSPARQAGTPGQSSTTSRPPTPTRTTSRPPTPTRAPVTGSTSMRTTPGNLVSESSGSSTLRPTPSQRSPSPGTRTTPKPATSTSQTPPVPSSSLSTPFFPPPSSTTGISTGLSTVMTEPASTAGVSSSLGSTPGVEPTTAGMSPGVSTEGHVSTSSTEPASTSGATTSSTAGPTSSPTASPSSSASSATPSPSTSPSTEPSTSVTPSTQSSTATTSSSSSASSSTTSPSPSPTSSPSSSPTSSPSSSPTSSPSSSPTSSQSPSPSPSTSPTTSPNSSQTPSSSPSTPTTVTTPSTVTTPTTVTTISTSTLPSNGGGQLIHTQIMFCNQYGSYYLPQDPITMQEYMNELQKAIAQASDVLPERIKNLYLVRDPTTGNSIVQFDVVPGPGDSTDDIVIDIQDKVKKGDFKVTDKYQNTFNVQCSMPIFPMCPWTDYGNCPDKRCMNGGKCNVAVTCHYYCECPEGWTGRYCEEKPGVKKKEDNLWLLWLLITPLAILALLLLLCCFCCWHRCCCWGAAAAAPQQKVQIIEEDIYDDACSRGGTVRSCRSACSRPSIYAVQPSCGPQSINDAGSTYYHALGRPFAVAFSDNTFSAVGYASNDMGIYNSCGKRVLPAASCCGEDEIEVIMNKPRRGSFCGSAISGGSGYHSALGNRYAVAYNDRAFNTYSSIPRHGSVRYYN